MLQIGRSLVRFQMVSLEFFIDIILPAPLWSWGRLSLKQKWVPGEFPGGKCCRCVRLTTLLSPCAVVMKSENLNFLEPSGPLQACNGTDLPLPFTDICPAYMRKEFQAFTSTHIKKGSSIIYSLYTPVVIHIIRTACFGRVAIIMLNVGPWIRK